MEPGNDQDKVVDLSQVLNQTDPVADDSQAEEKTYSYNQDDMPGLYGLVAKLSGGAIKTQKQAQIILVVLIILMNVITFSLLLKGKGNVVENNPLENIPAQSE